MSILLVTNALGMGGIEVNIVRLVREFVQRGHRVVVASRGGSLVPEVERYGGDHVPLFMQLTKPRRLLRDVQTIRRLVATRSVDAVHSFSATSSFLLACAVRRHRGRPTLVASPMGLVTTPDESQWRVILRAWMTSLRAEHILLISPAIEQQMQRLPISAKRLITQAVVGVEPVPPQARGPSARSKVRAELGLGDEDEVVLTVGRLEPAKSHELFVEAAAIIARQRPRSRFLLIGDGSLRSELEARVHKHGLATKFHFLGSRVDAVRLMAAADVYVRPGYGEGFCGITLLEAQAVEIPVVAFDGLDTRLAIQDRQTGRLAQPIDPSSLASCVVDLLDDPAGARAIAVRGREQFERTFAMDAVAGGLLKTYSARGGA